MEVREWRERRSKVVGWLCGERKEIDGGFRWSWDGGGGDRRSKVMMMVVGGGDRRWWCWWGDADDISDGGGGGGGGGSVGGENNCDGRWRIETTGGWNHGDGSMRREK